MGTGPLAGLKVLEFVGIGPGPYCAMLLSDMGASVIRVDRPGGTDWKNPIVDRGRAAIELDLKSDAGQAFCLDAADHADVVIEGFRPGVMERLGFGPDVFLARNPRLVYGRVTGWGQTGPLAKTAGHDINYIAIAGALAAMGRKGEPAALPLNLVGDLGGGAMFLAFGIMAALWEREKSGRGQVVDAAIVDGVSSFMAWFAGLVPDGRIDLARDRNVLGGAAPFYRCYICADGKEISIGPLEPKFFAELMMRIGAPADMHTQPKPEDWPAFTDRLAALFRTRSSIEWRALLEGAEACFAPVVSLEEAPQHPHLAARNTYVDHEGLRQAAPAPRFSRTPGAIQSSSQDARAILAEWQKR